MRILLHELELPYEPHASEGAPAATQLGAETPTMQVPTLRDGNLVLWESGAIADYLLSTYPHRPQREPPLAKAVWRQDWQWRDKLVFSTIQTFGTAVTTISQLTWTGVSVADNPHLARCAERTGRILSWLEGELPGVNEGFLSGCLSVQDVFLACHIRFAGARPLGLTLGMDAFPKTHALLLRLDERESFATTPIRWWDPDVIGYAQDGQPIYPTS